MATITSLGFSIFSTYSGTGVSSARRDINDLNSQLDRNNQKLKQSASSFFSLSTAAMALGPALSPIGQAALGGAAAFVTMSAAGIGAAGVLGGAVVAALHGTGQASKDMQAAAKGVSTAFVSWGNQVAPMLRGPFVTAVNAASTSFAKFTPLVAKLAPLANEVANAFKHWIDTNLQGWVSWLSATGVPILANFITIGKNLARVFGDMLKAFAPMALSMSSGLARMSAELKGWADGGGFVRFMEKVQANGPAIHAFFDALWAALKNVGSAMAGLGPLSLNLTTLLLRLVAAMPPWMIQAIVVAILAWRTATLLWAAATVIATAAQIALTIATSPFLLLMVGGLLTIGLWVLALAALGVGLYFLITNWNTVWNAVKTTAETVWNFLTHGLGQLVLLLMGIPGAMIYIAAHWSAIWNGMKVAAEAVWNALKIAWAAFVLAMTTVWQVTSAALVASWNAIWTAMGIAARAVWTALQIAWNAFITGMALIWQTVSTALVAAWNAVWNGMAIAARAIWTALQVAWSAFINALNTIWQTVSAALHASWNAVWNAMSTAARAIWSAMQAAWSAFLNAIHAAMTATMNAMHTAWNAVWTAIKGFAESTWNALKAAFSAFGNFMKSTLSAFMNAMHSAWNAAWTAIKGFAESTWNALKSAFGAFSSAMKSAMSAMASALKTAWNALWTAIKGFAQSTWNAISGAFKTFSSGVQKTLSDLVAAAKKIWGGIVAVFKTPVEAIVGIWNKVAGAIGLDSIKLSIGGPVGFARGGHLASDKFPGTSTNDRIPALLSAGEYVVRASSVRKYGVDMLNQVNAGHFASGGVVSMATGGSTDPPPANETSAQKAADAVPYTYWQSGEQRIGTDNYAKLTAAQKAIVDAAGIHKMGPGGIGGIISSVGGFISGLISDAGGFITSHIGDYIGAGGALLKGFDDIVGSIIGINIGDVMKPLLNAIVGKIPDPAPPGTPKPAGSVAHAAIKTLVDSAIDFFASKQQASVQAISVAGAQSVSAWAPVILEALALAGAPASWLGGIEALMAAESGGNPNAINNWDINAQNGVPSQGLMQVIPPTFAAYHQAGTSWNILDPLANIAAAINYIQARYGYVPGSPYALGTTNATAGWHRMGEHGPEMWFNGGERVWDAHKTRKWMHEGDGSGAPVVVNVENHWHGNPDKEAVQYAEGGMAEKLRQACAAGVGKRPY